MQRMIYPLDSLLKKGFCGFFILVSCTPILAPAVQTTRGLADKQEVGRSAQAFLDSARYTRMAVEIQFAPGMRPRDRTINNFTAFLNRYLDKPGGITVTLKQVGSAGKPRITTRDADSFAVKNRVLYTDGNLIALYIYFADAISAKSWIGGVAFRNTALVVFEKALLDNAKGFGNDNLIRMETVVLEHETGHLLGLVNHGTSMTKVHEDVSHKFHCSNRNCLMYHSIGSDAITGTIGNAVPLLDANCISDLKANRKPPTH